MTTRRKAQPKPAPAVEPAIETEREQFANSVREYREPASFNLAGCMTPIMFFMMLAMMVFLVYDRTRPVAQPTIPVVVPATVADLSLLKTKLASDKAKAAIVADAYTGLRDALAGPSGQRVTDSRVFELVSRAFLTDLDARGGVAVGTEIDAAIGAYLGMVKSNDLNDPGWEPMQFDSVKRARLVEIVGAIAYAAEGLR